ncbi:uncharacterized protein LOC135820839 [Sycon ciliatum]|uniref:uncharacterized protein LOC135820839 n=1 Tax=Sycon ciliatum TaxID=27933 RepID=UPI0020AA8E66
MADSGDEQVEALASPSADAEAPESPAADSEPEADARGSGSDTEDTAATEEEEKQDVEETEETMDDVVVTQIKRGCDDDDDDEDEDDMDDPKVVRTMELSRSWHGSLDRPSTAPAGSSKSVESLGRLMEEDGLPENLGGSHELLDVTYQKSKIDVKPVGRRPGQIRQRRSMSDIYVADLWAKGAPYDSDDEDDGAAADGGGSASSARRMPGMGGPMGMMGGPRMGFGLPPGGLGGFKGLKPSGGSSASPRPSANTASGDASSELLRKVKAPRGSMPNMMLEKEKSRDESPAQNAFGNFRLKQTGSRPSVEAQASQDSSAATPSPFGQVKLKSRNTGTNTSVPKADEGKSAFEAAMLKRKAMDGTRTDSTASDAGSNGNVFGGVLKKTSTTRSPRTSTTGAHNISAAGAATASSAVHGSPTKANPFAGVLKTDKGHTPANPRADMGSRSTAAKASLFGETAQKGGGVSAARSRFSSTSQGSPLPNIKRESKAGDGDSGNDGPSKSNPFEGVLRKGVSKPKPQESNEEREAPGTLPFAVSESNISPFGPCVRQRAASTADSYFITRRNSDQSPVQDNPRHAITGRSMSTSVSATALALGKRPSSPSCMNSGQKDFIPKYGLPSDIKRMNSSPASSPNLSAKAARWNQKNTTTTATISPNNNNNSNNAVNFSRASPLLKQEPLGLPRTTGVPKSPSISKPTDDVPEWKKKLKSKAAERQAQQASGTPDAKKDNVPEFQRVALRKTGGTGK